MRCDTQRSQGEKKHSYTVLHPQKDLKRKTTRKSYSHKLFGNNQSLTLCGKMRVLTMSEAALTIKTTPKSFSLADSGLRKLEGKFNGHVLLPMLLVNFPSSLAPNTDSWIQKLPTVVQLRILISCEMEGLSSAIMLARGALVSYHITNLHGDHKRDERETVT